MKQIYKQQSKGSLHFFVPLGMKKWCESIGIHKDHVSELDWWDDATLTSGSTNLKFTCTPCQHGSGRSMFDQNTTLWASWAVEQVSSPINAASDCKVWFGGDTAYRCVPRGMPREEEHTLPHCPAFKEIGGKFGGFDLAMIPIGAYSPRFFMSNVHASPEDSVEIHADIKSRQSVGMHWATWQLTDERILEPRERLQAAVRAKGLSEDSFTTLPEIGATMRVRPQL